MSSHDPAACVNGRAHEWRKGRCVRCNVEQPRHDPAAATAWEDVLLIERGQPEGQTPTIYWQQGDTYTAFGGEWTEDPHKATRYATRADAAAAVGRAYFRGTDSYRIVEHRFEVAA